MGREDEGGDSNKPRAKLLPRTCGHSQGAVLSSPEAETQDKAGAEGVQLPGGALGDCNCVHLSDAPYFNLHKGCIWTSSGSGSNAGTAGLCTSSLPPIHSCSSLHDREVAFPFATACRVGWESDAALRRNVPDE